MPDINNNQFWIIFWSMVIGLIVVLIIHVHANDLDDNKYAAEKYEARTLSDRQAVKTANQHTLDMATLGYIHKQVITCIDSKCTVGKIWEKQENIVSSDE